MILPESELKLIKFDVLDVHLSYNSPKESTDEIDERKYIVDLDFNVTVEKKTGFIFIFTRVAVNSPDAQYPCHIMDIETGSVFTIESVDEVTKDIREMYIRNSAIGIAFNNLRGFIQNITSYSPIGAYTLPLFGINILISEKYAKKKKSSTRKAVKKVSTTSNEKNNIEKQLD